MPSTLISNSRFGRQTGSQPNDTNSSIATKTSTTMTTDTITTITSPNGCRTINDLPDLCLWTIFSNLDLPDLLQMHQVCPLWADYQLRLCSQVHTLTLLIGSGNPIDQMSESFFSIKHANLLMNDGGDGRLYPRHQYGPVRTRLWYEQLNWESMIELVTKLPNIHQLEIAIHWAPLEPTFTQVIHLLGCWAPVLVDLKMWFLFNPDAIQLSPSMGHPYNRLLYALNQLPVLERLTLDTPTALFRGLTFHQQQNQQVQFPQLDCLFSRLREFNLDSTDSSLAIQPLCFQQIEPNMTRLERIGLGSCVVFNSVADLKNFPPKLARKIVACQIHLDRRLDQESLPAFRDAISNYNSVTTLQLGNVHLNALFDTLNTLAEFMPELEQLELCRIEFDDAIPLSTYDDAEYNQLASVRVLTLHVDETINVPTLLHSHHWAWILPRLQVLELNGYCFKIAANQYSQVVRSEWLTPGNRVNVARIFEYCPSLQHIFTRYQLPLTRPEEPFMYELDHWALISNNGDRKQIEYLGSRYPDSNQFHQER